MLGNRALIEAVSRHVERWVGPITMVFHENRSELVHIDVHYVPSTEDRPFEVLVTSGMSERPMSVPAGRIDPRFAEMVAILPAGWPVVAPGADDIRNSWPLTMIKDLARYPHKHETWLAYGHSLSYRDEPSRPYAPNTRLNSVILLPPLSLPRLFRTLPGPGRRCISFWVAVPLYQEELDLKLEEGTNALLYAFNQHGIRDVIDPHRMNVALCEWSRRPRRSPRLLE